MSKEVTVFRVGNKTEFGTFTFSCRKSKRQNKWSIKMKGRDRQQRSNILKQTPLILLLVVLSAVINVGAQTSTTGDIAGLVTDPSAAVVTGVPIKLKNVDTGASAAATTNAQGSYNFSFLQPGNYSVSVSVAGFQKIQKSVTVTLGISTTVNLQLSLSSQSETVEVTDEISGVQTEDANLQTNFNAQQIAVLPNPGNDLSAVALTAPGVVMNTTGGAHSAAATMSFSDCHRTRMSSHMTVPTTTIPISTLTIPARPI